MNEEAHLCKKNETFDADDRLFKFDERLVGCRDARDPLDRESLSDEIINWFSFKITDTSVGASDFA